MAWGRNNYTRLAGRPKLDRGRKTHGAQWCFVTGKNEVIDYKQMKELQATDAAWKAFRKNHPDWELFKSYKEARRFVGLRMAERAGAVRKLQRQVPIELMVRRPDGLLEKIGRYNADFTYEERDEVSAGSPWKPVVEDVKGYKEDLYLWKKRHAEVQLGIIIRET